MVPYKLKVKNLSKSKKKNPVYLNLKNINFEIFFQEFIKDHKLIDVDTNKERIFCCDSCKIDKINGIYYGIIGSGDFGYNSEFYNVNTKKPIGKRGLDDAEKIKFYYLLKVFNDEAYLLLNHFKIKGIKTELEERLTKHFNQKNIITDKVRISINPLISEDLLRVKEFNKARFIRKRLVKDIESQVLGKSDKTNKEEFVEEKVWNLSNKKLIAIKNLFKKLIGNYKSNQYIEIEKEKFDKIKLSVEMEDGSTKTITLDSEIHYNEGVDQDFQGGFPQEEDFYRISKPYFLRVIRRDT